MDISTTYKPNYTDVDTPRGRNMEHVSFDFPELDDDTCSPLPRRKDENANDFILMSSLLMMLGGVATHAAKVTGHSAEYLLRMLVTTLKEKWKRTETHPVIGQELFFECQKPIHASQEVPRR
ncbi:unnamed protein product [Cylindrotheca closterium]|uniref:Uncharacterized protein n=1 Tax=Cylindrotheca closterium TaxID=2856 RepID=A0AAD2CMR5_9STRA|nr:unnamed protein product [Cylindrotheca closterium]